MAKAKTDATTPEVVAEQTPETGEFVNPFSEGVTYESFLAAIPEGTSVKDYCGDNLTAEEFAWLEIELDHFNNNKN